MSIICPECNQQQELTIEPGIDYVLCQNCKEVIILDDLEKCSCDCHNGTPILHDKSCCHPCSRCNKERIKEEYIELHTSRCTGIK